MKKTFNNTNSFNKIKIMGKRKREMEFVNAEEEVKYLRRQVAGVRVAFSLLKKENEKLHETIKSLNATIKQQFDKLLLEKTANEELSSLLKKVNEQPVCEKKKPFWLKRFFDNFF